MNNYYLGNDWLVINPQQMRRGLIQTIVNVYGHLDAFNYPKFRDIKEFVRMSERRIYNLDNKGIARISYD